MKEIGRLRNEIADLETKIWERPRKIQNVLDEILVVNHDERERDWIETLPFPLSAILHSYRNTDSTPKAKYERLLHFFHAVAAFTAIVHLSAFKANATRWPSANKRIGSAFRGGVPLNAVGFGDWAKISDALAREARLLLNDIHGGRDEVMHMYATAESGPVKLLASAEIADILRKVAEHRNRWTGHGGVPTENESLERLAKLREYLQEFQSIVGRGFSKYQLIETLRADILDDNYQYNVRRVMGAHPELEQTSLKLTTRANG